MTHLKIAIIMVTLLVSVINTSCNTLAISGPAKYKVDLQNHLLAITDEIDKEGIVSDKTMKRFDGFMSKSAVDFGSKGSYVRANEALDELKLAAEDPNGPFKHNNIARQLMLQCQDLLMTEVKD